MYCNTKCFYFNFLRLRASWKNTILSYQNEYAARRKFVNTNFIIYMIQSYIARTTCYQIRVLKEKSFKAKNLGKKGVEDICKIYCFCFSLQMKSFSSYFLFVVQSLLWACETKSLNISLYWANVAHGSISHNKSVMTHFLLMKSISIIWKHTECRMMFLSVAQFYVKKDFSKKVNTY